MRERRRDALPGVEHQQRRAGQPPHNIPGDILVNDRVLNDWGLHLIDVNLVMGNLLTLVQQQGTAWMAKAK